jgi:hypothetical protein
LQTASFPNELVDSGHRVEKWGKAICCNIFLHMLKHIFEAIMRSRTQSYRLPRCQS